MILKSKLFILGFVSKIFAAQFSVVSFNGSCKLSIDDKTYSMEQHSKCSKLYTTSVDVPLKTKYKYICGGKEDVERILTEETTHNELFGRALTVYDMPEFNYPDSDKWGRTIGRTELFDPSYVPIVIVDTNKDFFVEAGGDDFEKMTFILKDNVFVFNDVETSTKNDDEDKFQIKISLKGDDNIYHRNEFKFRPSAYDPTFIRQILYGDIAHAIGNPTHESISVRVYHTDGTGIGLYVLQEDVTTESFIRSAFYGNSDGSIKDYKLSPIYDCSTGADFNPDDPHHLGGFQNLKDPFDLKIELKDMMKKLAEADVTNEDQIKNIDENWLDIDTILKALALEYLAGHWDSYWFLTSNFVTYHPAEETEGTQYNYSKYKYYFVDQDFDQTWSVGMHEKLDPINFPMKPYTDFVGRSESYWKDVNSNENGEPGTRVIVNKLIGCNGLETCPTKVRFENHLKSIVKYIFNPVALGKKVNGYKERLDEEMQWDTSLTRLHKGTRGIYNFTYKNFVDGMETGVSSYYGIMDWTTIMADTVCKQFNMQYNTDSSDSSKSNGSNSAIGQNANTANAGSNQNPLSNANADDKNEANKNKVSMTLSIFTIILSFALLL